MWKIGLIFGIAVVSLLFTAFMKRYIFTDLFVAIERKDYEYFMQRINATSTRLFLPEVTREGMTLNLYIKLSLEQKIREQFQHIRKMKLSNTERQNFLMQELEYFKKKQDKENYKKVKIEMQQLLDTQKRK